MGNKTKHNEINIIQEIINFRPTESYILTYNIDPDYYERYFLSKLKQMGCDKNVLLVDSRNLNEQIIRYTDRFNKIGIEYLLININTEYNYCFHPKIYIFKKENKSNKTFEILCFVGSGNMSYSGLNTNREIFAKIEWDGKGKATKILKDISDYFINVIQDDSRESTELATKWIKNGYPSEYIENETDKCIYFPSEISIINQYFNSIREKRSESVCIVSPFYDQEMNALNEIIKKARPERIDIVLDVLSEKQIQNLKQLIKVNKINIYRFIDSNERKRYMHAKIIITKTKSKEYFLFGSANISNAALIGKERRGNHECCILNIKKPGETEKYLEIYNKIKILKIDDIKVIKEKTKLLNSIEGAGQSILFAEYTNDSLQVCLKKESSITIKVELMYESRKTEIVYPDKMEKNNKMYSYKDNKEIVKFVRLQGDTSIWIPVMYLRLIKKNTVRSSSQIEKAKEGYYSAFGEDSQNFYLDNLVEYIINDNYNTFRDTERKASFKSDKNENMEIDYKVTKKDTVNSIKEDNKHFFTEGLEDMISSIIEKSSKSYIVEERNEDEISDDEKESFSEEEKVIMLKKQEDQESISYDIGTASRKYKRRRKIFIDSEIKFSVLSWMCYYSLITLPHMPKLSKVYNYKEDKVLFIEDSEWEAYVTDSISKMGKVLFKDVSGKKYRFPIINISLSERREFNISIAIIFYSCLSIYTFIKNSLDRIGDEGYIRRCKEYRIKVFCATILNNCNKGNQSLREFIMSNIEQVQKYFPCKWKHVESIDEKSKFIDEIIDFINDNPISMKNKYTDMYWVEGEGYKIKNEGNYIDLF